jgi:SAM-dependent methyltransferase
MAESVQGAGAVVGVEIDQQQLDSARRLADSDAAERTERSVEFRPGDAYELPLVPEEWGTFDIVHSRFVLEHVRDAQRAVHQMYRALRPGGRIVLVDDDHTLFRLDPDLPKWDTLWDAYQSAYRVLGSDPNVGRRLVALLANAGCDNIRQEFLHFGSWAGDPDFHLYVENVVGILTSARQTMLDYNLISDDAFTSTVDDFVRWAQLPTATIWYPLNWAEGAKPAD